MLTSLAARQRPASARSASSRTSSASAAPRSRIEEKKGKSSRIRPSRQAQKSRAWPGAASKARSGRRAVPKMNAESAGGPERIVR